MKAKLITRLKDISPEGWITEITIWKVPKPIKPCLHSFKYSFAFIVNENRMIGFDNERGKGDHIHINHQEKNYHFEGLEKLADDFVKEVKKWKLEH